ncbi:unnamed protein product [Lampetra fluviatilis]
MTMMTEMTEMIAAARAALVLQHASNAATRTSPRNVAGRLTSSEPEDSGSGDELGYMSSVRAAQSRVLRATSLTRRELCGPVAWRGRGGGADRTAGGGGGDDDDESGGDADYFRPGTRLPPDWESERTWLGGAGQGDETPGMPGMRQTDRQPDGDRPDGGLGARPVAGLAAPLWLRPRAATRADPTMRPDPERAGGGRRGGGGGGGGGIGDRSTLGSGAHAPNGRAFSASCETLGSISGSSSSSSSSTSASTTQQQQPAPGDGKKSWLAALRQTPLMTSLLKHRLGRTKSGRGEEVAAGGKLPPGRSHDSVAAAAAAGGNSRKGPATSTPTGQPGAPRGPSHYTSLPSLDGAAGAAGKAGSLSRASGGGAASAAAASSSATLAAPGERPQKGRAHHWSLPSLFKMASRKPSASEEARERSAKQQDNRREGGGPSHHASLPRLDWPGPAGSHGGHSPSLSPSLSDHEARKVALMPGGRYLRVPSMMSVGPGPAKALSRSEGSMIDDSEVGGDDVAAMAVAAGEAEARPGPSEERDIVPAAALLGHCPPRKTPSVDSVDDDVFVEEPSGGSDAGTPAVCGTTEVPGIMGKPGILGGSSSWPGTLDVPGAGGTTEAPGILGILGESSSGPGTTEAPGILGGSPSGSGTAEAPGILGGSPSGPGMTETLGILGGCPSGSGTAEAPGILGGSPSRPGTTEAPGILGESPSGPGTAEAPGILGKRGTPGKSDDDYDDDDDDSDDDVDPSAVATDANSFFLSAASFAGHGGDYYRRGAAPGGYRGPRVGSGLELLEEAYPLIVGGWFQRGSLRAGPGHELADGGGEAADGPPEVQGQQEEQRQQQEEEREEEREDEEELRALRSRSPRRLLQRLEAVLDGQDAMGGLLGCLGRQHRQEGADVTTAAAGAGRPRLRRQVTEALALLPGLARRARRCGAAVDGALGGPSGPGGERPSCRLLLASRMPLLLEQRHLELVVRGLEQRRRPGLGAVSLCARMAVLCPGWALVSLGTLSVVSGVIAFFPGLSLQTQQFVAWSSRVACPVWAGLMAVCAGAVTVRSGLRKRTRSLAEASCALCVLSAACSVPHLSLALCSLLMGPLCRYSHAGVAGTAYLGQAVRWPYPYALWQETRTYCVEPLGAEWQHLALQALDAALATSEIVIALAACVGQGRRLFRSRNKVRNHVW